MAGNKPVPDLLCAVARFTAGTAASDADWSVLEAALDAEHGGFVSRLRTEHPKLKEDSVRICMLKEAGLTWRQMSVHFGIAPESVKRQFQRMKNKVFSQEN